MLGHPKETHNENRPDEKRFIQILQCSTENIEENYFKIAMAVKKTKNKFKTTHKQPQYEEGCRRKYLERVYCYELYHQLRQALNVDQFKNLVLFGEVDKSGSTIIRNNSKPDFILHKPGKMKNNFAIIEVKRRNNISKVGIYRDLNKLSDFVTKYQYVIAVYLIFGSGNIDYVKNTANDFAKINHINLDRIFLLHHDKQGKPAKYIEWNT